jgi:two-component system, NarL family, sensor histidine kinase UhpB
MKILRLDASSITTRLVLIAIVPAAMMFAAISLTLYLASIEDVKRDLRERGRLVSAALAQSSRYGVVSGNAAHLQRALQGLASDDNSIVAIEILDPQRRTLIRVGRGEEPTHSAFESPIRAEALDIDILDNTAGSAVPPSKSTNAAGFVRVVMTPEPALQLKRRQIYFGSMFVLATALVSMLVGLALAQRMRAPLRAVMGALRQIRQGQYDIRLGERARGELGLLQETIVDMAKGLNMKHQEMEERVAARTRELQVADAEKRRLIAHANDAIEEERRRIALEIHDGLNASLVSVRLLASSIVAKAKEDEQEEIARIAQRISDTTHELYGSVRSIVKQLRPEVIDMLGLKGAVEGMVRKYDEADPNCTFAFSADRSFPDLRGPKAMALYRAIQEGLSNVVKHAAARRVCVALDRDPSDGRTRITIRDDGKGFDPDLRGEGGLGLIGMRERISAVGGTMTIEAGVGAGTKITIALGET